LNDRSQQEFSALIMLLMFLGQ